MKKKRFRSGDIVQIIEIDNEKFTVGEVEKHFENGTVLISKIMVWNSDLGLFGPKFANWDQQISKPISEILLISGAEKPIHELYFSALREIRKSRYGT
ncbi:MAG: hypothetical protein Q4A21_02365 [bacterium]|nr:hypothetical protein [bacterium]